MGARDSQSMLLSLWRRMRTARARVAEAEWLAGKAVRLFRDMIVFVHKFVAILGHRALLHTMVL
jgi:hypothetical protein